ncbi:acetyl-CoA synthetase-like protein [Acephala macrosclerotiorum]|nr:acetyl-CoA synthetase-like protein [Acephala macrosclerotiorum]
MSGTANCSSPNPNHAHFLQVVLGISIYSPSTVAQIGLRLSYGDLLVSANTKARLLSQVDGIKDEPVVLLHFDNRRDGIEWFWATVTASCIPAIPTPFTYDTETRKKYLMHLQTMLKEPVILTSEYLVPKFIDIEGLKIYTIVNLQARKQGDVPPLGRGLLKKGDDTAALMLTYGNLLVGPLRFLTLIDRHRITHTFAPNFFLASLKTALEKPDPFTGDIPDLSCLRVLISGGEQCVVEACQASTLLLHKNCPSYDISNHSEFASLGSCVPGINMRITSDVGEIVAKNEIGNLEISGLIVFKEYFNNPKATSESFTKHGCNYFPHEVETALEEARIDGVTPSYIVVFPYRPKGSQIEVLCVVYLPSYDADDVLARVKATDAISTICTMQCDVSPYDIIPLTAADLPKSSLGKLSRAKIRTAFENGVFAEYKVPNDALIQRHRASQRQPLANDTEASIMKVFSEEFDTSEEDIGINTSLFEMGVSSIEIIRLKTRIESASPPPPPPSKIPIITMMTNPTISALALELSKPKEYNPIVTPQSGGSKTPLFLVHRGVGEVLVFPNLAKYIVGRPIYALHARGFDTNEEAFTSIPEIIAPTTLTSSVYNLMVHTPLPATHTALCSPSQIAKVLESKGSKVKFLGVLNLSPHIKFRMRQLDWISVLLHLSYFLDSFSEEHAHAISSAMHLLPHQRNISQGLHVIAHDYDPSGLVSQMDVFYAIF